MTENARNRVFRFVGIWDLLLTLPFALPFINSHAIELLSEVNGFLSPQKPFPPFSDIHLFFVQLFGILAVLWAAVRIHRSGPFLASYDTAGRLVVAVCMISFTLSGGSAVPLLFSASELGFGIAQACCLLQVKKIELKSS